MDNLFWPWLNNKHVYYFEQRQMCLFNYSTLLLLKLLNDRLLA